MAAPTTTRALFLTADGSNNVTDVPNPFDDVTAAVMAFIFIALLVIGVIGNLLTILVIATSKKLGNVFNQLILSLCMSDLISALISWINLYRRTWGFNDFMLPNAFCVVYWASEMWTSYVTAQHILSFAIFRFISVQSPYFSNKIRSIHAKIWISTIWCIAFVCGFIPFALMSGARKHNRRDKSSPTWKWPACTQYKEWLSFYTMYTNIAYPIFFYIPLIGVLLVSIAIGIVLTRKRCPAKNRNFKSSKRKEKEKQAILQLALIVGSFILGYVPFTIYEFWTINSVVESHADWSRDWMFGTVQYIALRVSECLNPLFYNLASTKMRKETYAFLRKIPCWTYGAKLQRKRSESNSSTSQKGLKI